MKPEFEEHFQKVIQLEGGFRLVKNPTVARIKHYLDLANAEPKRYGIYLRGWLNRAFKGLRV